VICDWDESISCLEGGVFIRCLYFHVAIGVFISGLDALPLKCTEDIVERVPEDRLLESLML
jgi:hypothetical protein